MKAITFRPLRAEEIEVRLSRCTKKGAFFLLYKDARCDMNILDETVGPGNWQRRHDEHRGNLFCSVGININCVIPESAPAWVWKEDAGSESNTEAEKGHASDSFKRACVNWGIGRELYTRINIFVPGITCESERKPGTYELSDPFLRLHVSDIDTREGKIIRLALCDKAGTQVFCWGESAPASHPLQLTCAECKKPIQDFVDSSGNRVSAERVAATAEHRFGVRLCADCGKKRTALEKVQKNESAD